MQNSALRSDFFGLYHTCMSRVECFLVSRSQNSTYIGCLDICNIANNKHLSDLCDEVS